MTNASSCPCGFVDTETMRWRAACSAFTSVPSAMLTLQTRVEAAAACTGVHQHLIPKSRTACRTDGARRNLSGSSLMIWWALRESKVSHKCLYSLEQFGQFVDDVGVACFRILRKCHCCAPCALPWDQSRRARTARVRSFPPPESAAEQARRVRCDQAVASVRGSGFTLARNRRLACHMS